MPFIFPKRFLRTRDILDPAEFNQDTEPVQELLDGELDRHNFNAADLKANVFGHESLVDTSDYNAAVGESAYYDVYSTAVECSTIFEHGDENFGYLRNTNRTTPNFVKPDGGTFRDSRAGTDADGYPSIVPNTGSWSAVKSGDLDGAMKLTVTTGQASLYINAYVQYVWQGFYEYKIPWRFVGLDADTTAYSWHGVFETKLCINEQRVLNFWGPTDNWICWSDPSYRNPAGLEINDESGVPELRYTYTDHSDGILSFVPRSVDASYAFALNEITAIDEARQPQLGGFHHISRGFYPSLVQFALRVDGKVIESTITGKSFAFEESAHGLRVDDSPKFNTGGDGYDEYVFGQRSAGLSMSYEADTGGRPGQKIRSSRAAACGPEVCPVRVGGVIPVSPGTHTVEIVARRLLRKRKKFEVGDFVGVFSRRLSVMSLPLYAPDADSELDASPVVTRSLQSEDIISSGQEAYKLSTLESRVNNLKPSDIKRRSLPNTHLPSKVKYWKTAAINPDFSEGNNRELISDCVIRSRFPGFKNTTFYLESVKDLDRVTTTNSSWLRDYISTASDGTWNGAGWQKLFDSDGFLSIASTTDLKIGDDEKVIIMADLEVRGLHPIITSTLMAMQVTDSVTADWRDYLGWVQVDKYLDLFALFNIGYRTGTDPKANWIIGSKHAPATINASAWANRDMAYISQYSKTKNIGKATWEKGYVGTTSETGLKGDPLFVDSRGTHTAKTNLGVTVPLMLTLDRTDFASSALADITEIAIFGSTTFPSDWAENEALYGPDAVVRDFPRYADTPTKGGRAYSDDEDDIEYLNTSNNYAADDFASPVGGRKMISGLEAHIGRCRLTVMKVYK